MSLRAFSHTDRVRPFSWTALAGLFILALLGAASAQAADGRAVLENIDFEAIPGDKLRIALRFSGPAPAAGGFTIDNPARLAIDLPNTKLGLSNRAVAIEQGVARSLRAVEGGERTRIVVNLTQVVPYDMRTQGNAVYVTLDSATSAAAPKPGVTVEGTAPAANRILDVDFRRGEEGQGRITVKLSSAATVVDLQERGGKIIVDFLNVALPDNLQRRLDVTDFATPVVTIDSYKQDRGARMVIAPTGDYEHLAYQAGTNLTIEVKPVDRAEKERRAKEQFGYTGERLSLNFQNIEVRAILQLLADFTGLNIVASDTVQGNITLRLKNVPWDQAMDIILKTRGLGMRQVGNVILIAPNEEIAAREKQELEAQEQLKELAPLRTEFFQVNYAKAADIAQLLKAEANTLLSERGNVTIDERTNTLMVLDTADKLQELAQLIERLDVPVKQVLIESRIVIANDDYTRSLGVRAGGWGLGRSGNTSVVTAGSASGADETATSLVDDDTAHITIPSLNDRLNVNLPVVGPTGQLALAILGPDYLVDLELSALQQEGSGEVISNPRVVTSNQKEALIEQGVEIPYQQATSSGATSVAFKKAVLSLSVTPQITPDDRVILDLAVNKDSVGQVFGGIPTINTRSVTTQVLVDNGDTVVLGGIYEQSRNETVQKVPLLGDLPLIGFLFRNKTHLDDKAELLIFVTPKILKEGLKSFAP